MNWANFDWGIVILAALGLAFLLLLVLVIRKMAAGKAAPEEEDVGEGLAPTRDEEPEPAGEDLAPSRRPAPAEEPGKEKERLSKGLARTRGGFIAKLGRLFSGKSELDDEMLDQVEEILFSADIGVRTSQELIDSLRASLGKGEIQSPDAVWAHIRQRSREILTGQGARPLSVEGGRPYVILVLGVNGVGKTTTIGKLAARLKDQGHSVLLAAGDTFRAAAVEQLGVWADRAGCPMVRGKDQADPTSVIVDAVKKAQAEHIDVVLADTAGRLHTKVDLMDELQKVRRALSKRAEGAPHETILVLDATTGQNAIAQARMFKQAMEVTGLVLTKLDGTAKGGVVLGIVNELGLPIRFIGIGEKQQDLRPFDPEAFVEALYQSADSDEDQEPGG